jgi:hypothetical protein
MASKIVRLERLESRVDLDNPFASLTDSELLVLIGAHTPTPTWSLPKNRRSSNWMSRSGGKLNSTPAQIPLLP